MAEAKRKAKPKARTAARKAAPTQEITIARSTRLSPSLDARLQEWSRHERRPVAFALSEGLAQFLERYEKRQAFYEEGRRRLGVLRAEGGGIPNAEAGKRLDALIRQKTKTKTKKKTKPKAKRRGATA